jgi:hypothetical protein
MHSLVFISALAGLATASPIPSSGQSGLDLDVVKVWMFYWIGLLKY